MAKKKSFLEKALYQASGIPQAKRKISKATGIPLTKSGRKQKAQRTIANLLLPKK